MRKFRVITEEKDFKGEIVHLTPILSTYYQIKGVDFRCIEHKKGEVKLRNEGILLILKEIW